MKFCIIKKMFLGSDYSNIYIWRDVQFIKSESLKEKGFLFVFK